MTITLIDDHKILSESIRKILIEQPSITEVIVYNSADEFVEKLPLKAPQLIITDLLMPGNTNGMKLIEICKENYTPIPNIITLTSITDIQTIKQVIRLGGKGYLSKSVSIEELLEAIQEVMSGNQYICKSLRDSLIKTVFVEEQIIFHLSPREKEVLHYVCSGLTIKEIAYNLKLSKHTVQYYHKCVLSKLKLNRTSDLIVFAMQNGLYIPEIDKK